MAQKVSPVSVYTCRSSRLLSLTFLCGIAGLIALLALIGLAVSSPAALSPSTRATLLALLGGIAAYGIVMAIQFGSRYHWVRFELRPDALLYIDVPQPDRRNVWATPWEKLEVLEGPAFRIAGRVIPLPRDLIGADSLLREVDERTRARIPFPSVTWPDTVQHPGLDDRLLAEVQRGILDGQTMQMMKRVQEATGIRSKECLTLVERLRKNLEAASGK